MKVFLHGRDNIGWSIDNDRSYTAAFLRDLGHSVTSNFLAAYLVHSVWWSQLSNFRVYPLRWKKIMATCTNEVYIYPQFSKAKQFVKLWIAPSHSMNEKLKLAGVDVRYQPFYVDENIFIEQDKDREELARELGIDYNRIRGKLVISSFQRDSLGSDLNQPKWQKNPELLVNILDNLPKDKFVFLLAGPRRHWIINQCKKLEIPYVFCGKEPDSYKDDIMLNILDINNMNRLYNLTDLYIVSSYSEGGPKAVLESAFTRTMILSTKVGLAPDFLDQWCIYSTMEEATTKIRYIMEGKDISPILKSNYEKAFSIASYKPMLNRWQEIYDYFKDKYLV